MQLLKNNIINKLGTNILTIIIFNSFFCELNKQFNFEILLMFFQILIAIVN